MKVSKGLIQDKFQPLTVKNEKLDKLDDQLDQMQVDFEEMKVLKEEERRQLQLRFENIYRKIKNTNDFITQEGKTTNETLLAFQVKFESQLKKVDSFYTNQLIVHHQFSDEQFDDIQNILNKINQKLVQEKSDRIEEGQKIFQHYQNDLQELFLKYETEKSKRIASEQNIYNIIEQESKNLALQLRTEASDFDKQIQTRTDDVNAQVKNQIENNQEFSKKAVDEFVFVTENLEIEMDNRLDHQENIVENLNSTVATIKDTLSAIGK